MKRTAFIIFGGILLLALLLVKNHRDENKWRSVVKAFAQRRGVDLLTASEVTIGHYPDGRPKTVKIIHNTEDELRIWRQLAGNIKPGTPLATAERLLPVYRTPPANRITLSHGLEISTFSGPPKYAGPHTYTSSNLAIVWYHVALEIVIQIGYNASLPDKPIDRVHVAVSP